MKDIIQPVGDIAESTSTERVADAIWDVHLASRAIYRPMRQKGGMTNEKYWVLRTIYVSGEQRIKDIASRIGTTASPVTLLVKQLEEMGYVRRERKSGDERVVTVSLTEGGRNAFESLREARRSAIASLFECLDDEEKAQLLSLLEKVLAANGDARAGAAATAAAEAHVQTG